jgi:hypothetical protein
MKKISNYFLFYLKDYFRLSFMKKNIEEEIVVVAMTFFFGTSGHDF